MDKVTAILDSLLRILVEIGNLIVGAIVAIEMWLRAALGQAGVPPMVQTVILVALALILIVGSLRLFGGLIRVAVVLVLVLIAIHILLPVIR